MSRGECCPNLMHRLQGFLFMLGFLTHLANIGSSLLLALDLYHRPHRAGEVHAGLLIGFVFLPIIVIFFIIIVQLINSVDHSSNRRHTLWDVDWLCDSTYYGIAYEGTEKRKALCKTLRVVLIFLRINKVLSNYQLYITKSQIRRRDRGNEDSTLIDNSEELEERREICRVTSEAEYLIEGLFSIMPQMWLTMYLFGADSGVSPNLLLSILAGLVNFAVWACQSQYWRLLQIQKTSVENAEDMITEDGKRCLKVLIGGTLLLIPSYTTTTIPAISLYASVTSEYFMLAHVLVYVILFRELWWRRRHTLLRDINTSFNLLYLLFQVLAKLIIFVLISLWFIKVMLHFDPKKESTVPSAVPSWVWPHPSFFMRNLASLQMRNETTVPGWMKRCPGNASDGVTEVEANNAIYAVLKCDLEDDTIGKSEDAKVKAMKLMEIVNDLDKYISHKEVINGTQLKKLYSSFADYNEAAKKSSRCNRRQRMIIENMEVIVKYLIQSENYNNEHPAMRALQSGIGLWKFWYGEEVCNVDVAPHIFCFVFWMNAFSLFAYVVRCALLLYFKSRHEKAMRLSTTTIRSSSTQSTEM